MLDLRVQHKFMQRVKLLRTTNERTQGEIAEAMGVNRVTYQNYELCKVPIPFVRAVNLMELFGFSGDFDWDRDESLYGFEQD